MNKKSAKRTLLFNVLCLVMSLAMLIGSTFAWFTDTAATGVNTIVAGNLDVELEYYEDGEWKPVDSDKPLFDPEALWEPGFTQVAYLRVRNAGTLSLLQVADDGRGYTRQEC